MTIDNHDPTKNGQENITSFNNSDMRHAPTGSRPRTPRNYDNERKERYRSDRKESSFDNSRLYKTDVENSDNRRERNNNKTCHRDEQRERNYNRDEQRERRTYNKTERREGEHENEAQSNEKTSELVLKDAAHERERRPRQQNRYAARPALGRKQPPPPEDSQQKKGRQPFDGKDHLYEIIKVRVARSQRLLEVNTNEKNFPPNTLVLIRVHRNVLLATTFGYRYRRVAEINSLPYILREANDEDIRIDNENVKIEKHAQELATGFAINNNLQMKVLSADLSHDHKNITINFASDVRVDFREMVAYLASQLKLRVEMYQLGLRNGTGLICALGSCGQRLCCGRFLGQFDPVAVKLLRAQGLATNPKRISGVCGRLYCCLSYEYVDYLKERRSLPKKGKRVMTRWGLGKLSDIDLLREEVVITYDNGETQRLSHNDYITATDDIIAKVEAEEITFPLEPARFYLNNDPSSAVETTLHTKAPELPPAKPHSRHQPAAVTRKATKTSLTTVKQPSSAQIAENAAIRQKKHRRLKPVLPPDITTNAAGLIVRRKKEDIKPASEAVSEAQAQNKISALTPHEERCSEDHRVVRKAKPRRHDEISKPDSAIPVMDPVIIQPPRISQAHPLPMDTLHPSNPRRRRPRPRPPIKPIS